MSKDEKQLADWLLVSPTNGERLMFAGPLEPGPLTISRVKLIDQHGNAWTLHAGLREGWLTEEQRVQNLMRAVDEELAADAASRWMAIETAPKTKNGVLFLHQAGQVYRACWIEIDFEEFRDADGHYIDQQDDDAYWMDIETGDRIENPTEWMPETYPAAPQLVTA